jgi:hypothetical protein
MIKLDPNEKVVLSGALKAWGRESQLKMAFGECGEFIALCGRESQGRATEEEWLSEIADVIIMMGQMRELFGPEKVDAVVDFKIDRLKQKLLKFYSVKGEV